MSRLSRLNRYLETRWWMPWLEFSGCVANFTASIMQLLTVSPASIYLTPFHLFLGWYLMIEWFEDVLRGRADEMLKQLGLSD